MVPEGGVRLHSGVNTTSMRRANVERHLKHSVLLTKGPFEGWRAYGPYLHRERATMYYRLHKHGEKPLNVAENKIDINEMTEIRENHKPFIDWLSPWKE